MISLRCLGLRNTDINDSCSIISHHARSTNMGTGKRRRAWSRNGRDAAAWAALNPEFYLKASEDGRMSFNLGAPCKHGHRFLLSLSKGAPIFLSSRIERLSTVRALRLRLPSGQIQFFERRREEEKA